MLGGCRFIRLCRRVRKAAAHVRFDQQRAYVARSLSCLAVKMIACFGVAESDGRALHGGLQMNVQVIERDGEPEYAVLPWAHYQALLQAAGHPPVVAVDAARASAGKASFNQIAALREAKGMTVEQLARNVGISPHYLSMIVSGERQPDAAIQRALAWHLGVDGWEAQP